ncbi:MAG: hypothetical protein ACO3UU_09055 [Minisyncoccia bacterium]|jgi:hypothetical protein
MSITNSEDIKIILANRRKIKSEKESWARDSYDRGSNFDIEDRQLINDIEQFAQRED